MYPSIETNRLKLICCTAELLEKIIEGNEALSTFLNVTVPDDWMEFGSAPFNYSLNKIREHPEDTPWWTYIAILKNENTLIGNGGYKGPPDEKGMVEIGYAVAPGYRLKGYATEMAKGLLENALKNSRVKSVIAHTLAQENASAGVLRKCGLQWKEEVNDPEDGLLWKWEIRK